MINRSKSIWLTFALALVISAVGCSNQWREADAGLSEADLALMMSEINEAQSQSLSSGDVQAALAMFDDPNTVVYFADSHGELGPVASILSLFDFIFITGDSRHSWRSFSEARIFFFDRPTGSSGRDSGLIIGLREGTGSMRYYGFTGTGSFNGDSYEAVLYSGGQKRVILRTLDVTDGDFDGVIQMQVYDFSESGAEQYNGKFSTLVGFGS